MRRVYRISSFFSTSTALQFACQLFIVPIEEKELNEEETNMNHTQQLAERIEAKREEFIQISDKIWGFAESRFQEFQSSNLQAEYMKAQGFRVVQGIAGKRPLLRLNTAAVNRWWRFWVNTMRFPAFRSRLTGQSIAR